MNAKRGKPYLEPVKETIRQIKKFHKLMQGECQWAKQIDATHSKNEKQKAIIKNELRSKNIADSIERERAKKQAGLTREKKSEQLKNKIALLSFMSFGKRMNLSPKELKRKIKRHYKKG